MTALKVSTAVVAVLGQFPVLMDTTQTLVNTYARFALLACRALALSSQE